MKMPSFKPFETWLKKSTQTHKVDLVLLPTWVTRSHKQDLRHGWIPQTFFRPPTSERKKEDRAGIDDSHQDNLLSMFLAQLQLPEVTTLSEVSRECRRSFSIPPYIWNWPVFCFVLNQKQLV